MSRRLIIFGNYLSHKSEVYVRDRQFPHSIPRRERVGKYLPITYPRSFAPHVPSYFFCLVLPLYFAEIRGDVKMLFSRVLQIIHRIRNVQSTFEGYVYSIYEQSCEFVIAPQSARIT